ncbi:hypothetical protein ACI2S3_24235 [Ralstonia nicotianae]
MGSSLGTILLVGSMLLTTLSQLAIAIHAFTGNPVRGVLCFVVPLYIVAYARRHKVGRWLMSAWYAGIGGMVLGTMLLS